MEQKLELLWEFSVFDNRFVTNNNFSLWWITGRVGSAEIAYKLLYITWKVTKLPLWYLIDFQFIG